MAYRDPIVVKSLELITLSTRKLGTMDSEMNTTSEGGQVMEYELKNELIESLNENCGKSFQKM